MPRSVPTPSLPPQNRQVLLVNRPTGIAAPEDFRIESAPVPEPAEGQILVRNLYLSVDPAQRGWAADVANYSGPVPLGTPMRALAVAVVLASRSPELAKGEIVYGFFGWQDYAAVPPSAVLHRCREDLPLEAFGSLLGINGITAWVALTALGRPQAGETLLVSTAAGSVGGFVGQIGKAMGCRTIGLTSSPAKIEACLTEFGYDHALDYRAPDLAGRLQAAAPDGIDIYYDNTGGSILDTALRQMRVAGRIVQCGTASVASWAPPPTGPRNEREILTRRLIWSGFVVFDHMARWAEAAAALTGMAHAGTIRWKTDLQEGIEAAPGALARLYAGQNEGKSLIRLA
ncbi:NADP-dependent oxidoreductase [Frigidibacter sp. MR17.14]|uniref:NADP-dependent oxidoreductase n=1 Tax=Frigidibacter sp. MR17.14 TaxID=3126509 RepID=UPI003012D564